jgi:DNA-binding CsgD family transcriptional regulator
LAIFWRLDWNYAAIARDLGAPVGDIARAAALIATLDPRPARAFAEAEPVYVTPDVYVHQVDGKYLVVLGDDGVPGLKIANYYRKALADKEARSEALPIDACLVDDAGRIVYANRARRTNGHAQSWPPADRQLLTSAGPSGLRIVAVLPRANLDERPEFFAREWKLTRRERQAFELLVDGATNKRIADALSRSESTAEVHVMHIVRKSRPGHSRRRRGRVLESPAAVTDRTAGLRVSLLERRSPRT